MLSAGDSIRRVARCCRHCEIGIHRRLTPVCVSERGSEAPAGNRDGVTAPLQGDSGASPDFNASVGVGALPAQVVQIKRRRRRMPRAEVTIIRPAAPSEPEPSDPPAGRPAESYTGASSAPRPASGSPAASPTEIRSRPAGTGPGGKHAPRTAPGASQQRHVHFARLCALPRFHIIPFFQPVHQLGGLWVTDPQF